MATISDLDAQAAFGKYAIGAQLDKRSGR